MHRRDFTGTASGVQRFSSDFYIIPKAMGFYCEDGLGKDCLLVCRLLLAAARRSACFRESEVKASTSRSVRAERGLRKSRTLRPCLS